MKLINPHARHLLAFALLAGAAAAVHAQPANAEVAGDPPPSAWRHAQGKWLSARKNPAC